MVKLPKIPKYKPKPTKKMTFAHLGRLFDLKRWKAKPATGWVQCGHFGNLAESFGRLHVVKTDNGYYGVYYNNVWPPSREGKRTAFTPYYGETVQDVLINYVKETRLHGPCLVTGDDVTDKICLAVSKWTTLHPRIYGMYYYTEAQWAKFNGLTRERLEEQKEKARQKGLAYAHWRKGYDYAPMAYNYLNPVLINHKYKKGESFYLPAGPDVFDKVEVYRRPVYYLPTEEDYKRWERGDTSVVEGKGINSYEFVVIDPSRSDQVLSYCWVQRTKGGSWYRRNGHTENFNFLIGKFGGVGIEGLHPVRDSVVYKYFTAYTCCVGIDNKTGSIKNYPCLVAFPYEKWEDITREEFDKLPFVHPMFKLLDRPRDVYSSRYAVYNLDGTLHSELYLREISLCEYKKLKVNHYHAARLVDSTPLEKPVTHTDLIGWNCLDSCSQRVRDHKVNAPRQAVSPTVGIGVKRHIENMRRSG